MIAKTLKRVLASFPRPFELPEVGVVLNGGLPARVNREGTTDAHANVPYGQDVLAAHQFGCLESPFARLTGWTRSCYDPDAHQFHLLLAAHHRHIPINSGQYYTRVHIQRQCQFSVVASIGTDFPRCPRQPRRRIPTNEPRSAISFIFTK